MDQTNEKNSESLSDDSTTNEGLEPGQLIEGRYKVVSLLGRGAVGAVYEVEQVFLRKHFALKVLDPIVASDMNIRRFQQEAQAASKLDHPNLAKAVDCGVIADNQPFLVMDLVEGETLQAHLKAHGKLPVELALDLFIQLCFALGYVHSVGVIHRDIKPSNIILTPKENGKLLPKIVDFGIAKVALMSEEEAQALTKTGEVFGTPLYMSPEQCNGIKVDGRSDIYSLGCVLFEALTQTPPFCGNSALETILRHQSETAPTLKEASLGEQFPAALEKIVAKMIAKKPSDRYANALDVAQDLSNVQRGNYDLIAGPQATGADKPGSKSKLVMTAVVSVLGLLIMAALFYMVGRGPEVVDSKVTHKNEGQEKTNDNPSINPDPTALANKEKPFSVVTGNQRVFTFPATAIGVLRWWGDGREEGKKAMDSVIVPASAPLVLNSYGPLYNKPSYLARFRSNELMGINLAPQMIESTEAADAPSNQYTDAPLRFLPLLQSLKMVSLLNNPISDDSLENVGALPNLHWLVMDQSFSKGDKLAKLANLSKLHVLVAHNIDSATQILSQLVKSNTLRRLSLNVDKPLTDRDVELICQLHQLNTLSILSDLDAHGLIRLCNMPKLKKLCLLGNAIDEKSTASLRAMKNLEQLTVAAPTDHQVELVSTLQQIKQLSIPQTAINSKTGSALKAMHHLQGLSPLVSTAEVLNNPDALFQVLGSKNSFKVTPIRINEGCSPVGDWFENYLNPDSRADLF